MPPGDADSRSGRVANQPEELTGRQTPREIGEVDAVHRRGWREGPRRVEVTEQATVGVVDVLVFVLWRWLRKPTLGHDPRPYPVFVAFPFAVPSMKITQRTP